MLIKNSEDFFKWEIILIIHIYKFVHSICKQVLLKMQYYTCVVHSNHEKLVELT